MNAKDVRLPEKCLAHALRNIRSFCADGWQFIGQSNTMVCTYLNFVHSNGSRMMLKYENNEVKFIINGTMKKIEKL